jgi:hypothetical protein
MALFDRNSIESIEQAAFVGENGSRRVRRNIARRASKQGDATESDNSKWSSVV